MSGENILSFTYGSNMASSYLRQYCAGATPVMRAVLPNMWIEFRRYSDDLKGGISTILPAPGEMVQGVLYNIPRAEVEALDLLEDVDKGLYARETFLVLGDDGQWHSADLYRIVKPEGPFRPSDKYIAYMREGAAEHGIPADYISRIAARGQAMATDI